MRSKRCISCDKMKPLSEYYTHPRMRDGHLNKCKACVRDYANRKRLNDPLKIMLSRIKICAEKPSHVRAYRAVEAAVACGALIRPKICSSCGRTVGDGFKRIEAHHIDYTEPLCVKWVCTPCHRREVAHRKA